MVKVSRITHSFPNGLPTLKIHFPLWDNVENIDSTKLKGLYRGDFLFFRYSSKIEEDKKINSNPIIIFEGIDGNGNIVGANIMFYNAFIDPKTGKKSMQRNRMIPVFDMMRKLHWDTVYKTGVRKSFLSFERKNYYNLFGRRTGHELLQFWRTYDPAKMGSISNLDLDSAFQVINKAHPKFIKSKLDISE